MVFTAALKVYSGFLARRFNCDVEEARERGHIGTTPYFNSVLRYIQSPDLTPIIVDLIEQSAAPMSTGETQFAVDSTGFSTCRFDRWFDHKWGKEKSKRQWIKAHAIVGVQTNIVAAIKITPSNVNDTTVFPELTSRAKERFAIEEISADKAYLSEKNLRHAESLGAAPYIPFKSNTTGQGSAMWRRLHAQFVLEVARLQGFDEAESLFPGMPAPEKYRLLGNAVCVHLAQLVGQACVDILDGEAV